MPFLRLVVCSVFCLVVCSEICILFSVWCSVQCALQSRDFVIFAALHVVPQSARGYTQNCELIRAYNE